ncbi:MAG TPA: TerC family protein [Devosiaceae bacterium]
MHLFGDVGSLSVFLQVVIIDLVLAGDNAVVIGMAAAGLPPGLRRKAILFGILAATVLRIVLAVLTTQLLEIVGLLFAGGLLLLWVAWKMWQELRADTAAELSAEETLTETDINRDGVIGLPAGRKTLGQAFIQILVADLSMSLDNVLAVAGAAREHPTALAFGLALSVALMGLGAALIAQLLNKYRWIAYLGLGIILVVALRMIFEGSHEVADGAAAMIGVH